ncbi:MAG: 1-deoxy-D-xylulose-5-phosphate reductoisomerase, partial [Calditrichaeota bacterium]
MKKICILGSTGSIGRNCLKVIETQAQEFQVRYLTAFQNIELLYDQAKQFHPRAVAIFDKARLPDFETKFKALGVDIYHGLDGLLEISRRDDFDIFVNALVGAVGLKPTLQAIRPNRRIAIANKETLVIGGQLVMAKVRLSGAELIPIDSEHSALLQCIAGEERGRIRRVFLTASGGPFRELPSAELPNVTVDQALNHPNWRMGPKITIDSATLMNKGLEVIEAHWLFDLKASAIKVVIHPQSIIHSMVEFADGSIKAQMGVPDMRIPIQYALTYPRRLPADFPRLDFETLKQLTFEPPDFRKFRCLQLCYDALEAGGGAPAVLNAANEVAVNLFLARKIRFDQIPEIVEETLAHCDHNRFREV